MLLDSRKIKELEDKAKEIRAMIVQMLARAGSGHPGGSLSSTDILTCLYYAVMRHNPKDPGWPDRDRFHLSKGHCCPALYAVLAEQGYFSKDELWKLRKFGCLLQGHPERHTPGIEVCSGSLGQGLSVALGMSLAARLDHKDYRTYCLLGDGEIQEGNIWEAAMAAAHYKSDNLCAILDYNGFQIDGRVAEVMAVEPLADKWRSFGWYCIEADGHNMAAIHKAFATAKKIKEKPTIIIAKTIKGKGVSFMENVVDFHGRAPSRDEHDLAMKELGME
ncbi:MAG: transketolase [Candidatus Omnitrophica bacterium]|nr:transketolase [Candidatus Omnitrophota bacterium]